MEDIIKHHIINKTEILLVMYCLTIDDNDFYYKDYKDQMYNPKKTYTRSLSVICNIKSYEIFGDKIELSLEIVKFIGSKNTSYQNVILIDKKINNIKLRTNYPNYKCDFDEMFSYHVNDIKFDNYGYLEFEDPQFESFYSYLETQVCCYDNVNFQKKLYMIENYKKYEKIDDFKKFIEENKDDEILMEYVKMQLKEYT